jgi:hypothetical protein
MSSLCPHLQCSHCQQPADGHHLSIHGTQLDGNSNTACNSTAAATQPMVNRLVPHR